MAVPPVKLLLPSALKIDADTPCVLQMHIPIALPHRLDPSVPAPPYHPGTVTAECFRDLHAMPLLRRLIAQIVSQMFGPEYAAAALTAPTRATSESRNLRLLANWDASAVVDKENGFNVAAGYWKDIYSGDSYGPIYAYEEDPWGRIIIFQAFKMYLVCGVRDAKQLEEINPRALRFDIVEDSSGNSGHELVFEVREYTEDTRRRTVNVYVGSSMEISDAPVTLGQ